MVVSTGFNRVQVDRLKIFLGGGHRCCPVPIAIHMATDLCVPNLALTVSIKGFCSCRKCESIAEFRQSYLLFNPNGSLQCFPPACKDVFVNLGFPVRSGKLL